MAEEAPASGSIIGAFVQWSITIKETLAKEIEAFAKPAQKNRRRTIFRVRKRSKESLHGRSDMACYTPESISLGLFHRPGRYDAPQKGETFKIQMAAAFLTSFYTYHHRPNEDLGSESQAECTSVNHATESTTTENEPALDLRLEQSIKEFRSAGRSEYAWRDLCHSVVGEAGLQEAIENYDLQEDDRVKVDEPTEFLQWTLTLDAIVVGCLFGANFCRTDLRTFPFPLVRDCVDRHSVYGAVPVEDFIKLENQIPLFLLRKVLNIMWTETDEAKTILNGACAKLAHDFACYLPGHDPHNDDLLIKQLKQKDAFLKCDHLLGCVASVLRLPKESVGQANKTHTKPGSSMSWARNRIASGIGSILGGVSRALKTLNKERKLLFGVVRRGFVRCGFQCLEQQQDERPFSAARMTTPKGFNIPSATLLHEAGIKVRGCSRTHGPDLLPTFEQGWLRATLFVPKLPILPAVTWTLWRNVVAYECERNREDKNRESKAHHRNRHNNRESQLHAFLAFMDCLVDTKDDVLLLTQGKTPVLPEGFTSNPEDLAEMFNTILTGQPFVDYKRWMVLADQINNYGKHRVRKSFLEFSRKYIGKPWLVISVLAAIGLFILTFLQTLYSMLSYYP